MEKFKIICNSCGSDDVWIDWDDISIFYHCNNCNENEEKE
ncbi:hypothetical protein Bfsp1_3 [Cytobacillus phage Bfsp1]|nr:hypothetical protein Bfsp1_3 [Cytobacillus phage Bfsp1]